MINFFTFSTVSGTEVGASGWEHASLTAISSAHRLLWPKSASLQTLLLIEFSVIEFWIGPKNQD